MELLQVDIDEMKEHLQTLESEIEEFRPFVESGFADEITMVQAMRSDFTPALEDVLKNISDKDAVRLLETLEKYKNAAMFIVESLEQTLDQNMEIKLEIQGKADEEKIKDYLWPVGSNAGAGVCFSQCVRKHGQCHRNVPEHSVRTAK